MRTGTTVELNPATVEISRVRRLTSIGVRYVKFTSIRLIIIVRQPLFNDLTRSPDFARAINTLLAQKMDFPCYGSGAIDRCFGGEAGG